MARKSIQRSKPLEREDVMTKMERLEFLAAESRRRRIELEPMYYGCPDLLFPQGFEQGTFDMSTNRITRPPLPYAETLEQYAVRQNQALYDMVTQNLYVVKDDKYIKIKLIPKMAEILGDLFYERIDKIILWANRGGGKSLLAAVYMWINFTYKKRSCLNMGGCILPGSLVWTRDGWEKVEDVLPGRLVLSLDGRATPTSALVEKAWVRPVTHVQTWGWGPGNTFTRDHRVLAVKGMFRYLRREGRVDHAHADSLVGAVPEWVAAGELTPEDAVAIPRPQEPSDASSPFTLRMCRLIGLWAAEGSLYTHNKGTYLQFSLGVQDMPFVPELLATIREELERSPSVDYGYGMNGNEIRVRFGHSEFAGWLQDTVGKGALRKNLTPLFETMSNQQVENVLVGLFRGDGCVKPLRHGGELISYCTHSPGLSASVYYGALRIGLAPQVTRSPAHVSEVRGRLIQASEGWVLNFTSVDVDYLGPLVEPWRTFEAHERRPRPVRVSNGFLYLKVKKIEDRPYVGPVYDLTVPDGESFGMVGLHAHNSGNQARRVYDYTKQFWHNFPGMLEGMLYRDPLLQSSEMKNGSKLVCSTSVSTAIGEHIGVFVADEACTDRPGADNDLMRAMQGALSEDPHSIFLLSTFHLPIGFFADVWDSADDMEFTRVSWNCFDTMKKCSVGMELATEEDPKAIESFCKPECPLSWEVDTSDEFGNVTGQKWVGCLGTSRNSNGWQDRKTVLEEQKINIGTRIFTVEHACIRPEQEGHIYNRTLIDGCVVPYFNLQVDRPKTVGIDWGLTQCAVVLLGEWIEDNPTDPDFPLAGLGVVDVVFMSNRLTDVVVDQIKRWQLRYGDDVVIRADGSHPYCNQEVANHGYRVIPVHGDRKLLGEDNLARWLGSGSLRILEGFELFMTQLHNLRRNIGTGKQLKQNLEGEQGDHGPDALKFAMMQYSYTRWFELRKAALAEARAARNRPVVLPKGYPRRQGLDAFLT